MSEQGVKRTMAIKWLFQWRRWLRPVFAAGLAGSALWLLMPPAHTTLPGLVAGDHHCTRLTFSPDSRCLATVDYSDHTSTPWLVQVWDLAERRLLATVHRGERQPESIAFTPVGLAMAIGWFDGGVTVYDCRTGTVQAEYRHDAWHNWNPHGPVVYTPAGRLLVYGPDPAAGTLWDAVTGDAARTLFANESWNTITCDHAGFIIAFHQQHVKAWRLASGTLAGSFTNSVAALRPGYATLTDDGRLLAGYEGPERRLKVWSADGDPTKDVPLDADGFALALAPDGTTIAVTLAEPRAEPSLWTGWLRRMAGTPVEATQPFETIRLINIADGHVLVDLGTAKFARFAPDGHTLAVAAANGPVYVYAWPTERSWQWILGGAALAGTAWLIGEWLIVCVARWLVRRNLSATTRQSLVS